MTFGYAPAPASLYGTHKVALSFFLLLLFSSRRRPFGYFFAFRSVLCRLCCCCFLCVCVFFIRRLYHGTHYRGVGSTGTTDEKKCSSSECVSDRLGSSWWADRLGGGPRRGLVGRRIGNVALSAALFVATVGRFCAPIRPQTARHRHRHSNECNVLEIARRRCQVITRTHGSPSVRVSIELAKNTVKLDKTR